MGVFFFSRDKNLRGGKFRSFRGGFLLSRDITFGSLLAFPNDNKSRSRVETIFKCFSRSTSRRPRDIIILLLEFQYIGLTRFSAFAYVCITNSYDPRVRTFPVGRHPKGHFRSQLLGYPSISGLVGCKVLLIVGVAIHYSALTEKL